MKEKKCKDCGKPRGHNLMYSRCKDCQIAFQNNKPKKQYELKRSPLKRPTEIKISKKSKTNKNVIAEFSTKTKKEIYERQNGKCIISGNPITDYHHAFYGGQANKGPNRNDSNQGVGLSYDPHRIIHFASPKESALAKLYRAKCINYLILLK